MSEINLINKFFYDHDVPVFVAAKHPKTKVQTALKTPGHIRYKLIPYAAGIEFSAVFRLKTELESAICNQRRDPNVRVRFDDVEFALEVPRVDPVTLNYTPAQLLPLAASLGRSYAFGQAQEHTLQLTDSNSAHTLIAGITGSGKSEMLRVMLASLIDNNSPDQLQVLAIDLKNRGLLPFADCPHVRAYVTDPEQATAVIRWVADEITKRTAEQRSTPRIVLAIDELAELASGCGKAAVHEELSTIARLGRELGVNIIAAAQKPDAGLIGGQLKSQFGVKVIGQLDSAQTAAFITGRRRSGAESLPGKGAMLLIRDGGQPLRIQGYFVGDAIGEHAAQITEKYEAKRLQPIQLPPVDEVAKAARKAKPAFDKHHQDGKLQRGGVGAVVEALYGEDAANAGSNNRFARRVIDYLSKGPVNAH